MRWLLLLLPLAAVAADLRFAWDYAATNPPASFILAGAGQTIPTPLKTAEATNVPPGLHSFQVAATNATGGATSAPVAVRVVKLTVERAGELSGPWQTDTLWFRSYALGPTNGFLRMRLDWE